MTHGSLFSGIGGFDLAAEWMGWENIFHCEWNLFGQKVLKYHFPNAISYEDITKTDFTIHRGRIDILTGGFPCQPYSMAGKRLGKEDERHLWPEMLRAIREIHPRWVVGENVLGLVNWSGGLVFHEVQADLEAEGYEVQPYVLPACAVNAPHRRDRVWFVAYASGNGHDAEPSSANNSIGQNNKQPRTQRKRTIEGLSDERPTPHPNGNGLNQRNGNDEKQSSKGGLDAQCNPLPSNGNGITSDSLCNGSGKSRERRQSEQFDQNGIEGGNVADTNTTRCKNRAQQYRGQSTPNGEGECCTCGYCIGIDRDAADTDDKRLERECRSIGELERGFGFVSANTRNMQRPSWDNFPTQSPICTGDDGLSSRLDGITFPKWRNESIKAGGNAIVPQVVHQIFKAIEQYEKG
jgi:DNA (cytosine-5)-methyltransferase 1